MLDIAKFLAILRYHCRQFSDIDLELREREQERQSDVWCRKTRLTYAFNGMHSVWKVPSVDCG